MEAFQTLHTNNAVASLSGIIKSIVTNFYDGQDTTYPRCSRNQRWKMGPVYGQPYQPQFRALIATWYVSDQCQGTWLQDQIDILTKEGWAIPDPWVDFVTTADLDALEFDPAWGAIPRF